VCFGANAVSFIAVIGSLLMMRLPKAVAKPHGKNVFADLKDGFEYILNTPTFKFILLMLASVSLFVLPFSTLIPVYAKDIFKGTASTFGVIDSVIGLGAFGGGIFLASLSAGTDLKKILAINTLVFGVGLIAFSHMHNYAVALLFAAITGFGMMSQITIGNTIIQTTASPEMRGRVISFYAMSFFGMQPLGGLLIGAVSQKIGVPDTVMAEGMVALLLGIIHFSFLRRSRLKKEAMAAIQQQPAEVIS
ncbi:MAG: transporter, partial [Mucilaginibacter sp.]|nr:transporter [Mucilaginibacter sp.]